MLLLLLLCCAGDPSPAPTASDVDTDAPESEGPSDTDEEPCRPAAETCNQLDDDCDGLVDEEARDRTSWYLDADGDDFGAGDGERACEAPEDHVALDGDCDDENPDSFPDAPEHLDGRDEDCDGSLDRTEADHAALTLSGTPGLALGSVVHADGSGLLLGAPDRDGGSAWWVAAPLTASARIDAVGVPITGEGELGAAVQVGAIGLFVGEPLDDTVADGAGRVLYFAAPPTASSTAEQADGVLLGPLQSADAGRALALGTDGAGLAELLVGMPDDPTGGTNSGRVSWVGAPFTGTTQLGGDEPQLVGDSAYQRVGWALTRDDVDGDGLQDALVGSPGAAIEPDYPGRALVVLAGASGQWGPEDCDGIWTGGSGSDFLGLALVPPGDVDGDGYADVWLGAPGVDAAANAAGAAYLLQGPATGTHDADEAWATVLGDGAVDYLGQDVGAPGDLDGDGLGELLVGAFYADDGGDASGTAYLFYGLTSGVSHAADAGVRFIGDADFDVLGVGFASTDQDGDGLPELWIGAGLAGTDDRGALHAWEAQQAL